MAKEQAAFEAHAGHTVTVHRGDGSALVLKPGEPYETSDADEIALLSEAAFVKSASVEGKPAEKKAEGGKD
jgi:hypothetical protein